MEIKLLYDSLENYNRDTKTSTINQKVCKKEYKTHINIIIKLYNNTNTCDKN